MQTEVSSGGYSGLPLMSDERIINRLDRIIELLTPSQSRQRMEAAFDRLFPQTMEEAQAVAMDITRRMGGEIR